jgi:hypothetical protein
MRRIKVWLPEKEFPVPLGKCIPLEAADGMLLFGTRAAYTFTVMQAWQPLLRTLRH